MKHGTAERRKEKMTNEMIIFKESQKLMNDGILQGSGVFATVEFEDGARQVEMPEEIHTFQAWKSLGYSVKKGEKAIAKFPIWKYTSKKVETEDGEEKEISNMFMKTAAFFKMSQIEIIKVNEVK